MKIIIIGLHKGLTRGVIYSLFKNRYRFTLIGSNSVTHAASCSRLCDSCYEIEDNDLSDNTDSVLKIIRLEISPTERNYIIPACTESTYFVSKYVTLSNGIENNYPISDYETLAMLDNKWSFYLFLKENNLSTPETHLLNKAHEYAPNKFPILTKPLNQQGGRGIIRSDNQEEFSHALFSSKLPILAQEFIDGSDINLGILSCDGRIVSYVIHEKTPENVVLFKEHNEVLQIGKQIVESLNFSGIIHFDFRYDGIDGTVKVLECNPRVWGSMIHAVFADVNFIEIILSNSYYPGKVYTAEPGKISLTKQSLINKFRSLTIQRKDIKPVFKIFHYFLLDPKYTLIFYSSTYVVLIYFTLGHFDTFPKYPVAHF